jgi:enamine deaminase RidA (YjgF/YER057c/UK114 family)
MLTSQSRGQYGPGETLYVSGWLDPEMKTHTDITSQTVGLIKDIQKFLESQKLTLSDVVIMRVYLGSDPAKDGKPGFTGMMAGYTQFFGIRDQPNKARAHHAAGGSARCFSWRFDRNRPDRSAFKVAVNCKSGLLIGNDRSSGFVVEIERFKSPVAFQKEACHYLCWEPKGNATNR